MLWRAVVGVRGVTWSVDSSEWWKEVFAGVVEVRFDLRLVDIVAVGVGCEIMLSGYLVSRAVMFSRLLFR